MSPGATLCGRTGALGTSVFLLFQLGISLSAADYFIRASGSDTASGDTTNSAWQTIERVNRQRLQPGDRLLFETPTAFRGNLRLSAEGAGGSTNRIVVTSFGAGRATILAGSGTGIAVENAGGIVIENLVIVGAGYATNSGFGILCDNTLTGFGVLDHLRIENVEVSGFGRHGILIGGLEGGFRHVRIKDCLMHDNQRGGMEIAGRLPYDSPGYAHADVRVTACCAFNNPGDPNYLKSHSGSGIVLYQVDGGVIDHCAAWNNGAACRSPGGGPVGIWTCASRRIVIQNCESFSNRTSRADGGGFDIDGGCEQCVLQYNYSHDNDGPGLMVYTYPYASHADRGNVVRFNISENDSRKSRTYAGLWLRSDGPGMSGVEVYHNTIIVGPRTDQAVRVHGGRVEAHLRNNIFIAAGEAIPLRVESPSVSLRFENNLYWREGASFQVAWGEQNYASLEKWRSQTGQESLAGRPVGFSGKPKLMGHPSGFKVGQRLGLLALRAFQPLAGSPAVSGGLDLRRMFGLDIGSRDSLGEMLPAAASLPLGAVRGEARP